MAGINFDGIQNLPPELQRVFVATVKADQKALQPVQERRADLAERQKLLTDVIGKVEDVRKILPSLSTPLSFRELNVASADDKVVTGTADKNVAEMGKHSLEVLGLAKNATALSNRFPDKDSTKVGTGYFVFSGPTGEEREVFIDNENSTLEGLVRVINSARVGLRASVVNDQSDASSPFRLILTAEGAGAGSDVEYPEFYFIDGDEDFYIDEKKPATNARIKYEGFEMESPTNEVKDLVRGVTLNLKGMSDSGKPVGLSVEQDVPKTTEKVKDLVDKVNKVFGFIQEQNTMDEKTDSKKTLGGDYSIRTAENRLRSALQDTRFFYESSTSVRTLSDVGIEFTKKGTLAFDQKKFENAINANYDGTVALLTGDGVTQGVIPRLSQALSSLVVPGMGVLSNQKKTYTDRIGRADEDISRKEKNAEKRAELLRDKLSKVQGTLSKLQGQGSAFAGMGGGGGGGGQQG